MAFTGKATYAAGSDLPEVMEDVSDIVGIVSPHETPLLDHLGDAGREATSTVHEWLEDELLPNTDQINQTLFTPDPETETVLQMDNASRFRVGDVLRTPGGLNEAMLVVSVSAPTIEVTRGYGGTTPVALADNMELRILGNAALEGADKDAARFTSRTREANYTQIFSATVEVSGSMRAARLHAVRDELEYQKQERIREMLRDLENTLINGVASSSSPQGSATVRRTMRGLLPTIQTNQFQPGVGQMPDGGGAGLDELTEPLLNAALREVWQGASGGVDTIVVGGGQKRRINSFVTSARSYLPQDTSFKDMVSVYESDFGVCRVVLSRWVPDDTVLLVDSSRVDVMPLRGRSFGFKELGASGDADVGQVIGEYTAEIRNERAHGALTGLAL